MWHNFIHIEAVEFCALIKVTDEPLMSSVSLIHDDHYDTELNFVHFS